MIVAAWARRHERLVATATWLFGVVLFFRDPITTGFDTITGDRGDARLTIFLHEHWMQVAHAQVPWASPPQFFPAASTLGYSDTFFLNQIFYIPLRMLGLDQFVAFQCTLICLTGVGFAATFAILRRHMHVSLFPACVLSSVATFSNDLFVDTGHPQIYAVNFVPVVVLLVLEAFAAERARRRHSLFGGAGLLLGLLAYSNFYMGWFVIFVALIIGAIAAILSVIDRGVGPNWTLVRSRGRELASFIGGFAIAMVPFLLTYVPVLDEVGGRSFGEVLGLSPSPGDLINVGRHNVVWGWLIHPLLGNAARLDALNRAVAPTPVLLTLTAWAAVGSWR